MTGDASENVVKIDGYISFNIAGIKFSCRACLNIFGDEMEHELGGIPSGLIFNSAGHDLVEIEYDAELDEVRKKFRERCEALHNRTNKKASSHG